MNAQRGQVLVFFALALPLILLPVVAYAVDASVTAGVYSRLVEVTARAAEEAAQQIDAANLRAADGVVPDLDAATRMAKVVLAAAEPAAILKSVTVSGQDVRVITTETVVMPFNFVRAADLVLRVSANARIVAGYESPSSRLPLPTSTF